MASDTRKNVILNRNPFHDVDSLRVFEIQTYSSGEGIEPRIMLLDVDWSVPDAYNLSDELAARTLVTYLRVNGDHAFYQQHYSLCLVIGKNQSDSSPVGSIGEEISQSSSKIHVFKSSGKLRKYFRFVAQVW